MFARLKRSLSSKDDEYEARLAKLEESNSSHSVRGRVKECGGIKSFRKYVFQEAELKHAFYMADDAGIYRDGSDLVINMVFASYDKALTFESALLDICVLFRIPKSGRETKPRTDGRVRSRWILST